MDMTSSELNDLHRSLICKLIKELNGYAEGRTSLGAPSTYTAWIEKVNRLREIADESVKVQKEAEAKWIGAKGAA